MSSAEESQTNNSEKAFAQKENAEADASQNKFSQNKQEMNATANEQGQQVVEESDYEELVEAMLENTTPKAMGDLLSNKDLDFASFLNFMNYKIKNCLVSAREDDALAYSTVNLLVTSIYKNGREYMDCLDRITAEELDAVYLEYYKSVKTAIETENEDN
ncbi:hypothetical protein ENBRE01_1174 [Enteropsectra breve]|nr:hypothetical protein ENBRE01_1174 [Enteropsectra breve]